MTGSKTATVEALAEVPVYVDIRRAVGGIQFTIGPLPDGRPWIMRLAYETAAAFSDALTANTVWGAPLGVAADDTMYAIIYEPGDGGGWIIYAHLSGDIPERAAEWGCAAEALHNVAALLRDHAPDKLAPLPGDPEAPWSPEDFHLCGGCGRPVFDSMPTMMVTSPSAGGLIGMMCESCGIREMEIAEREGR